MKRSETYNVKEELEQLSPLLASLPKKSTMVYDVPAGYFEKAEKEILAQARIHSYEGSKPGLPDGYFAGMEDRFMASAENKKTKRRSMVIFLFQAAAAVFVVVLTSIIVFRNSGASGTDLKEDVAQEEYFNYLQENIDEVDIETLAEYDLVDESDLAVSQDPLPVNSEQENGQLFDSEINF